MEIRIIHGIKENGKSENESVKILQNYRSCVV